MRTELIHSYSTASLAGLSRSSSTASFNLMKQPGSGTSSQTIYDGQDGLPATNIDVDGGICSQLKEKIFRRKFLEQKFPIFKWLPRYNVKKMIMDIIAGITVGLTILPQAMAYAQVGALPAQIGLYSCFTGSIVYILFGSTKDIKIGPTAILAIMTLSYTRDQTEEVRAKNAVLLCFLMGIVVTLMGVLQLGFIVNFISTPVRSGFTSAAAITICSTQLKAFFGFEYKSSGLFELLKGAFVNITEIQLLDTLLSLICIVALFILQNLPRFFQKLEPGGLKTALGFLSTGRSAIVVIICTLVFFFIGENPTSPVAIIGEIQQGLPPITLPPFSFVDANNTEWTIGDLLSRETSALITMPLLALMEHHTSAKAFATNVDINQEMIANGLTNIFGAFLNSMATTGSLSLTTVNNASGSQTPLGGVITIIIVLISLQFLTPVFAFIPKAGLAAVIVYAVVFMIDLKICLQMWRSKKADLIPWFVTFSVSLFVALEYGILCGFVISLVYLLYYAARPRICVKKGMTSAGSEFILIDLDRSLIFPSVEYTRYVVQKSGSAWAQNKLPIVIDCHHISFADFTAASGMRDLFDMFNKKGQPLILFQVKPSIIKVLTGIMEMSGTEFIHCTDERELETLLAEIKTSEDEKEEKSGKRKNHGLTVTYGTPNQNHPPAHPLTPTIEVSSQF